MTYSDEEIEALVADLEQRTVRQEVGVREGFRGKLYAQFDDVPDQEARKIADALRQLLSEVRALREETEPCDHSEVEEAGAIWWRCVICNKFIDRNQYPEPSEIPPGVGQ